MRDDLLPCPFCGAEAEMVTNRSGDNFARCTNRQCAAKTRLYHENENGARMAWNRRALPAAVGDIIEACDGMLADVECCHDHERAPLTAGDVRVLAERIRGDLLA